MNRGLFSIWWRQATRYHGLTKALSLAIPTWATFRQMRWPIYGWKERWALQKVLRSQNWGGAPSPNTHATALASRFARLHGVPHGICTSSGTTALQTVYRALGLTRGDEIIIPALTFSSVASAAVEIGLQPVFADIDPRTLCLDPASVLARITPRTAAVVAVHLGSQLCDLDAMDAFCQKHTIPLIEDCAHAHGAAWRERGVGSWGIAGCFSFQSTKTVSAGEGGMIVTRDSDLAARCRSIIDCGRQAEPGQPPQQILGSNYRLSEFQTAILLAQLDRLDSHTRIRARSAALLDDILESVDDIEVSRPLPGVTARSVYSYSFRYVAEPVSGAPRDRFLFELFVHGIPASGSLYVPVYEAPEYGQQDPRVSVSTPRSCPSAERAARETVWLPHTLLLAGSHQVRRMARIIAHCVGVNSPRGSG